MLNLHAIINKNRYCLLFVFMVACLLTNRSLWAETTADYWQLPIPLQGDAPKTHHPITHDINPTACAVCHKKQFDEWQDSYHAKAASAGLIGQLHYFDQDSAISCLSCHTPRSEQIEDWQDQTLKFKATGIDCASCHLRQHQRYGVTKKPTPVHGTVQAEPLFKKADFCSRCHQFSEDRGLKLAGSFLENTHQEWQQSKWGQQNKSCQSCHMPNGSHRFKGIHDADMTRSAFKIQAIREATGFKLSLSNQFAGHALPTYATPRIIVTLASTDGNAKKVHIIQRQLFLDKQQSLQQKVDTRLQAGETIDLFLRLDPKQHAVASIRVEPDHFYQQVIYPYFLEDSEDNTADENEQYALQLLRKAKQVKRDYTLYDIQCPNWQQKNQPCTLSPQPPKGELMPTIEDRST
jgi:putative hemolysin